MDWRHYWDQAKDLAVYWLGWQFFDWLKAVAVGAVVTFAGWLIARYRQSPWQREVRGALIGFSALTVVLALISGRPISPRPGQVIGYLNDTDSNEVVAGPAPTPAISSPTAYRFGDQFASNLKNDFLSLPRPCVMKITAPQPLQHARGQLVGQAMNSFVAGVDGYGHWLIPGCSIIDQQEDQQPELYGHRDFPAVGIVIHTSDSNLKVRTFLAGLFRSQSIPVSGDSTLPPGSPPSLIYIELGRKLWE